MDWFLRQRMCFFLLWAMFPKGIYVHVMEPENTQSASETPQHLPTTILESTLLPTVGSPREGDFSPGEEETTLETSREIEEFNLCIQNTTQTETWDELVSTTPEMQVKNHSQESNTSMPPPNCIQDYVQMEKELPRTLLLSCIVRQSRKAATIALDLPPNVHSHLSGGHWLGEATQLNSLSKRLPPSCVVALCHPDVNVSFRVVDSRAHEESVTSPVAFMAMYGQAAPLLDLCRGHLQALPNITKVDDPRGNTLYQIADHYWLIFFQNQKCHHTDNLNKISALITMQVLYDPPPICLQNVLCSPSTFLQPVKMSQNHYVWIPFIQGQFLRDDLVECFLEQSNDSQDREADIGYLNITLGRVQHELVLFKNPQCHVKQLKSVALTIILKGGNIPPSSCLSLLCDQHFQLGIHLAEKAYLMVFGISSSLWSQCRIQLSTDSRSNRTISIEGFTFPLNQTVTFFLPDSDCFAATLHSQAHLFLSIMSRNVTIPRPCMALLCSQHIMFHPITNNFYYIYSKPDNPSGACFETLAPNVQTDDVLRIIHISPTVNMFLLSPTCSSLSTIVLGTFRLLANLMYSNITLPPSCYSHLCHGLVGYIESLDDKTELYYMVQPWRGQSGCYSSLLRSTLEKRMATDSNNCSFVLLHLPSEEGIDTMTSVSDPRCQYTCSDKFTCHQGPHVNFFFSLLPSNNVTIPNKLFQCLAATLDRLYENQMGLFSQYVQNYGRGVRQRLPDPCIRLACDPSFIIGVQSETENKLTAQQAWNIYVTFHSLNDDHLIYLTACNRALRSIGEDVSLHSKGTLIRSHISHRNSVAFPDHIFLVFPSAQCFVVQNLLKASAFSYFLTVYREIPLECVEKLLCSPDINADITVYKDNPALYLSYQKDYDDIDLSDECREYFLNNVDFPFPNTSMKIMYHMARPLTLVFTYIIFDFSFKAQEREKRKLITYLLNASLKQLHLMSCLECIPHSRVIALSGPNWKRYLLVPHLDNHHCYLCYHEGDRVTNFPTLVILARNEIQQLYMLPQNATYLTADSEESYEAGKRYLYFVSHGFGECARLDKGDFKTLLYFHRNNPTNFYLIQLREGLPCLEEIKKSNKFSCFESKTYVLCRENEGINIILYLYDCHVISSAKFEKLSILVLDSLEAPNISDEQIRDICSPETRVASYVIPGDLIYFETVGRSSNLTDVLASLQTRWRLSPASLCIFLFAKTFHSCATAYNLRKINEIVQSRTGVAMQGNTHYRVIYQCINFSHPNATLRLYRLLSTKNFVGAGKDICNRSFETRERSFFSVLQNGNFSIEPDILRNSRTMRAALSTVSKQLDTSSCPALMNDINLDFVIASVVQNNSACLQDLCMGDFVVPNDIEGEGSLIGPLSISMYQSPCFKAIPPQVWRRINRAFLSGRATLNKFWPGCSYDYIVISSSKDASINEWTYLPPLCKVRETAYFTGELILTIITIAGNLVVIYTLFYHAKMSDASCRLRVNLAFADLLVGLFVQSRALHNHLSLMTGDLTLRQLEKLGIYDNFEEDLETSAFGFNQIRFIRTGFDAFSGFAFSVSSFVSLTFMSLMTLERYLMVAHQRHHGKVFKNPWLTWIILGTWIGGFVFSFLLLQKEDGHEFVGYFDPISKITTSLPSSSIRSASFLAFYTTVVFFSITSLLVVVLSVLTFWRFSTSHERLRKKHIHVQDPLRPILIQRLRVILTVFVAAYMISCVPLVMGSALNVFLLSPACHQIIWWIYLSSSAWNCYLYNLRLSKFRVEIVTSFYWITTTRTGRWMMDVVDDAREYTISLKNKISPPDNVINGAPRSAQQDTSSF